MEKRADKSITEYDPLTKLPLFPAFLKSAEQFFTSSYDSGLNPAMVYFDLNGIRTFIARRSMERGNQLIKDFSDLLRKYFGNKQSSRPDPFYFYAFTESSSLSESLPSLLKDLDGLCDGDRVIVRAGVFNLYNRDKDSIESVCHKARFACMNSGERQGSGIFYFDEKMDERLNIRSFIIEKLDDAIKDGHIKVFYQSKVRLLNDKFCGAEALTRWEDPEKGIIHPSSYIPVTEDESLTWKIDTFVLREVAKHIRSVKDLGLTPLPVSVNLTYVDFLVLNVPDTVESIVKDNGIDNSLIVIEITEKTVLKNPEMMREEIEKLHQRGFKVLIDDFGNGYSSLNMLSDFRFDAIKVDMELMRNFTERNRKIVESIIVMAKNLGIHTISEGVETKEQLDFLRSIGCETVQGYYFGLPSDFDSLMKAFSKHSYIERETPEEATLYDKAGLVNLVTGQALALSFFNGERFDVFYANNDFYRLIASTGYDPRDVLEETANSPKNETGFRFREAAKKAAGGGSDEDLEFSYGGKHFVLYNHFIAGNSFGNIYQSILHTAESLSDADKETENDEIVSYLVNSFHNIYYVDLAGNTLKIIKAEYGYGTVGSTYNFERTIADFVNSGVVFPSDSERFLQAFERKNIMEKLDDTGRSSYLNVFRLKINDVNKWVTFRCSPVPGSRMKNLLLCATVLERESQTDLVEISRHLLNNNGSQSEPYFDLEKEAEGIIRDDFLWNTLMDMSDVRYFWKDRDRRFLGASKSFLDFYGFESVYEILGKNDEEMGWHPDDTQYRSDELDVLGKGVIIRNSPGQIYAKGAKVNILATKYPIYKNGVIVGLIGYFMDSDTVLTSGEEMDHALFVDIDTGLLNSRGLFLTLQSMDDNYRNNGTDYAAAMFEVSGYHKLFVEYGKDKAEKLTKSVGNTILRFFPEDVVSAKTSGCGFTICLKGDESSKIIETAKDCAEKIKACGSSVGIKEDLVISFSTVKGSEKGSLHEVFTLLLTRFNDSKKRNHSDIDIDDDSGVIPDFYKDFPIPFLITRPVISMNGVTDVKFVFANNKYCEYSGSSRIDIIGKGYADCFDGNLTDWINYTGRAANGETVSGRVFEASMGQWMDYIATPSSIPGCCNTVFWPVEDSKKERDLLTKGHEADNAIIRIARFLNKTGEFESGIHRSFAELGRVLKPDRVYLLNLDGIVLYEWCTEGILSRMTNAGDSPAIDLRRVRNYSTLDEGCIVVEDVEILRKLNKEAYDYLTWEGIHSYIIVPLYDNQGDIMGFLGVDNFNKEDIPNTRRLLEEASYFISSRMVTNHLVNRLNILSNRDELTGLLNRHGFHEEIDAYLDMHPDDPFTLVLIDVDDFKIVNDMYGHATGDEVLQNLSSDLNNIFGENTIIARTGGDELSLAIKGFTAEMANPLIKELSEMEHIFMYDDKPYPFRLSIGFAEYPAQTDNLSMLLTQADSALYNVKAKGKHGFRQYSEEIGLAKRLQLAFNIKNVARYVPGAILVYKADEDKRILYANEELITMFECDSLEDFMDYTGGTFDGIVHPEEIEVVDDIIWKQIDPKMNYCKDYVDYRIITKKNNVKEVIDCGRYVDSEFYGKVFYVMLLDKDEWRRSKEL